VLVLALLSLGFQQHGAGRFLPYRLLYEVVPGWQGIRVPGRLHTLTTLALALLAAGGAARIGAALAQRPGRGRLLAAIAGAALFACVVIEGAGFGIDRGGEAIGAFPHPSVPVAPVVLDRLPQPLLQLPAAPDDNRRYLLWSTDGFPKMVNGRSSFEPRFFVDLLSKTRCFPDAASLAYLRKAGVRTVVVHTDRPGGARPASCAPSPADLGVRGYRLGPVRISLL
jgi:hypothetical protein